MAWRAEAASPQALQALPVRPDEYLQAREGRQGSPRRVVAAVGHSCMATDRSTEGMPVYPKAAPPSRVVRAEEPQDLFRAVKGAFHDLVSSSCTSGKNGTGGGAENQRDPHRETTRPASKDRDAVEDSTRARHSRRPGKA